jgi:hypothetical protein
MTDIPRPVINKRQSRSAAAFNSRSKRWTNSAARIEPKKSQDARRNYEQYLALARAEAQIGNTIGAPTISTLSIIFGRCPRTKKEQKGSHQMQLACSVIHNDFGTASERRALL